MSLQEKWEMKMIRSQTISIQSDMVKVNYTWTYMSGRSFGIISTVKQVFF